MEQQLVQQHLGEGSGCVMNPVAQGLAPVESAASNQDGFGFVSAKAEFNPDSLRDLAYEISGGCNRAEVILRRVEAMFREEATFDSRRIDEMWLLVEMALEYMPNPDLDVFDPMEKYLWSIRPKLKQAAAERQALARMVDLMAQAGRTDASIGEIRKAANEIHDCATSLPDGRQYLDAFCGMLRSRGYLVEQFGGDGDLMPVPKVFQSSGELKAWKKALRKTKPLMKDFIDELVRKGLVTESDQSRITTAALGEAAKNSKVIA